MNPPDHLNPAPPPINFDDPAYRQRFGADVVHVAKIVATIAAVARVVPGPAGRILGAVFAGVHKEPDTGKIFPTLGMAGNFAPSPIGYMDATSYGLRRNWLLPNGVTAYIPDLDLINSKIPGIAEQRIVDSWLKAQAYAQRLAVTQRAVEFENEQTLRDLVNDTGGAFSRASELRAFGNFDYKTLKAAAGDELALRALPERPPPLVPVVIEQADGTFKGALIAVSTPADLPAPTPPTTGTGTDGSPTPPAPLTALVTTEDNANGGFNPISIRPLSLIALATYAAIEWARREYVTERADP